MASYLEPRSCSTEYCQENAACPWARSLLGRGLLNNRTYLYALRCRRWSCGYCCNHNKRVLYARVRDGRPQRFITLTSKPLPGETPVAVYKRIRPRVTQLVQAVRDKFGWCECVCVVERFKTGFPHFHILARSPYIPQAWLSDKWLSLTGAGIVDIRRVADWNGAGRYVVKYVVKEVAGSKGPRFGRVISFTRGYRLTPVKRLDRGHSVWRVIQASPAAVLSSWPRGWGVTEEHGGWTLYPRTEFAEMAEEEERKERLRDWWIRRFGNGLDPPVAATVVVNRQQWLF